jgi:hypothetical protein
MQRKERAAVELHAALNEANAKVAALQQELESATSDKAIGAEGFDREASLAAAVAEAEDRESQVRHSLTHHTTISC